jgi:uncharacterized membrane protein
MTLLMGMYIISGLLMLALSIPLILRRVPPNPFYGFRVPATLADSELWYDVNAYAGRRLALTGVGIAAAAVLLPAIIPAISIDVYAIAVLVVVLGLLIPALATSFVYSRKRQSK